VLAEQLAVAVVVKLVDVWWHAYYEDGPCRVLDADLEMDATNVGSDRMKTRTQKKGTIKNLRAAYVIICAVRLSGEHQSGWTFFGLSRHIISPESNILNHYSVTQG
jgi:hypothetical protein